MATVLARELLEELVDDFGPDLIGEHRWFDERERWRELVYAILSHSTSRDGGSVREACNDLEDRGLLDSPSLLSNGAAKAAVKARLVESGLTEQEIDTGLRPLETIASFLDQHHSGKLQLYLRRSLERLADELGTDVSLTDDASRTAIRFWLQNILAAPLSLRLPQAISWCETRETNWDELVAAADEADVNVALLDDLVLTAIAAEAAAGVEVCP